MLESYTSALTSTLDSNFALILDDLCAAADPQPLQKFLYSRKESAWSLGISCRSLDYLIANKQLSFRKLGKKVMIPATELSRFAKMDHRHLTSAPGE
jgi:hypothetical protein